MDDLLSKLETTTGEERLRLLVELAKKTANSSVEESLGYATQAYESLHETKDKELISWVYYQLLMVLNYSGKRAELDKFIEEAAGIIRNFENYDSRARIDYMIAVIHSQRGNHSQAIDVCQSMLGYLDKVQDVSLKLLAHLNIGVNYTKTTQYDLAQKHLYIALDLDKDSGNEAYTPSILFNLGILYRKLEDWEKSFAQYKLVLEIAEKSDDDKLKAMCYSNIGVSYLQGSEYDRAIEYFLKCLKLFKKLGIENERIHPLNNLGNVYLNLKEFNKALKYFEECLELSVHLDERYMIGVSKANIAGCYQKKGDLDQVLKYLGEASTVAETVESIELNHFITESYIDFYKVTGDFEKCVEYHEKYLILEKKIFDEDKTETIYELETKYKTQQKEHEAELLTQKNLELEAEIAERKKIEAQKEELISELKVALSKIKVLSGLVPICANCKKIRDDKGFWNQMEKYISDHSDAVFSHGICPDCIKKLYPNFFDSKNN